MEIRGIEILSGRVIRADAQMRVGATLQRVEVNPVPPLLETAAANASTSVGTRMVEEIPLAGGYSAACQSHARREQRRRPQGSNFGFNSARGTLPDAIHMLGSDLSVNGGQAGAYAWYLDGNVKVAGFAKNVEVNPIPDAVSEFQAIMNAFSAEYGRAGGAVFNVVLKSGTNALQGSIYEFPRQRSECTQPLHADRPSGSHLPAEPAPFQQFWNLGSQSQPPGFYFQWLQKPDRDPMMPTGTSRSSAELKGDMMISVSYVGSHGTHLLGERFQSFSYVHTADRLKYKNALCTDVPIFNFYSGFTAQQLGKAFADPLSGQTATQLQLAQPLTPYPSWSSIPNSTSFEGTSTYHGLNFRLQNRFSHALSFVVAYTISRRIVNADTSSPVAFDPGNLIYVTTNRTVQQD